MKDKSRSWRRSSSATWSQEFLKVTNLVFGVFEPEYVWSQCRELFVDCCRCKIEARSCDEKKLRRGSIVDGDDVFFDVDECEPGDSHRAARASNAAAAGVSTVQDVGTSSKKITEVCE